MEQMSLLWVQFNRLFIGCFSLILLGLVTACKNDRIQNYNPTPHHLSFPSYFPDMEIPSHNKLTVEGIRLGRKLYYDVKLHPSQSLSCSFCHNQQNSFSSPSSNCMPHVNLGFSTNFLWNGHVQGELEDIMLFEVEDFFGTDVSVLQADEEYPAMFKEAFGTSKITTKLAARALAQFFRTLNSYRSRYDGMLQGTEFFTPQEWDGYDIFFSERGDCFHCHGGALMTDNLFHNNGLDQFPDDGRYEETNNPGDLGKFKTPTLRNIELTGPYMHDARYQTLEEVIEFYSSGLQWSETIDPLMKKVQSGGAGLTAQEKENLLLFLKTLTDSSFINNPDLSDPN